MTIAAGFVVCDGVLLCADSQYTSWDKSYEQKVFCYPVGRANLAFALCGDKDYARTAIQDSVEAALAIKQDEQTIWTVRKAVRRSLRRVLADYKTETHLDQARKPEFLVAIGTPKETRLFSSRESAFPPIDDFDCRGTGSYLANYVIRSLRFAPKASMDDVLPIAVRAISAAKQHDANCGGGSQFALLRQTSVSSIVGYDLDNCDDATREFDRASNLLFGSLGGLRISNDEFKSRLTHFDEEILRLRKNLLAPGSAYRCLSESLTSTKPISSETDQT